MSLFRVFVDGQLFYHPQLSQLLDGIFQIGKAGFAHPCVGVVEVTAFIQRPALKHDPVILFTDNGGRHGPNQGQVRVVEGCGKGETVDVICVLLHLCFCDGELRQLRSKLLKTHGGYLSVRYTENGRLLDYLADFSEYSVQTVEFGRNLLNVAL